MEIPVNYRFSGHETFACRYAWLPKAIHKVQEFQEILTPANEDLAMVELGVGKNMVRSIRFWAEASGMIQFSDGRHVPTELGRQIFLSSGRRGGLDPYLEDIQTLWLLHWKLATNLESPIFAWDFLLSRYFEPELSASSVFEAVKKAVATLDKSLSENKLEQQFEIFLHSYVPTRGKKGEVREDNLDCPLVELELLQQVGHRPGKRNGGKPESVYVFRREPKPEISPALFAYCLDDFWRTRHSQDQTLSFSLLAAGHGSPGQVFKLPEDDLRRRVESIGADTDGFFDFSESASISSLTRRNRDQAYELALVYAPIPTYA